MATEERSTFLRACRGLPVARTPIWIMRQAGRYLPAYRALRERASFLDLCHDPDLVAEATRMPIDTYDLDAAILFSDLTIPLEAMGLGLEFNPAPVLARPVRDEAAVTALPVPDPAVASPFLAESVTRTLKALRERVPLIGFAGAPFTLACYAVEGAGSRSWARVKQLAWQQPVAYATLLAKLAETSARYLEAQIAAGCQAVQLFDSWAGILSREDYAALALPWVSQVVQRLQEQKVPVIYFAPDAAAFLDLLEPLPVAVLGVDWRLPLDLAAARLPHHSLQGNLDPALLFAPEEVLRERARAVCAQGKAARGHIFNLGHGILPETPPASVEILVDEVHRHVPATPLAEGDR